MSSCPSLRSASLLFLTLSIAACGSDTSDNGAGGGGDADAGPLPGDAGTARLEGSCPAAFAPVAGRNTGFSSDGMDREFHVLLPEDTSTPRPVFVALTGTVQEELAFAAQAGLDQLTNDGWVVVVPVRTCSQNAANCATAGPGGSNDGRIWEPWFDGAIDPQADEGPDVRFIESAVRCVADEWQVDPAQVHVGGISAGGSFTNRNMTFNSDFFAGGVVSSGNWYNGLAAPAAPPAMDPSIVILVWGGPGDVWPDASGVDYSIDTRQEGEFYAAQPNIVTLSCSGTHGHIWPTAMTPWLASTLGSHPKGTPARDFRLTEPPAGLSCVLGAYTDH